MDFTFTPEQDGIRESIRAIVKNFPDDYWLEKDQAHEFPWDFYRAIADAGYFGLIIPEEYGGAGLGMMEAGIVIQEIAASGAGGNGSSSFHTNMFGVTPVVKHGSEEMRRKYLPDVISGDLQVCFGVTEPDAGTDTTRITTRAVRDGDRYVINGRKVWLSKAGQSQKVLLLTRTTPLADCRKRTDGMSLFFADLDPTAVTIRPISKMGRNAVPSNEVFFDNLSVPESDLVGEEGRGFHYLLDGLNPERIIAAFLSVGLGYAAIRRATQYANDRTVFGRPIGQNQGIQLPLAEAYTQLYGAEVAAQRAAWLFDKGLPCGPECNMAKYLAAEASYKACDQAVQTHGGFGYASEYHVERYFREARLGRIAPISSNLILAGLAEHVLGLPRSYGRSDGS